MAIVNKPWDGDAARYPDADSYCAACLVDDNPSGKDKVKNLCHLPVKEPNGDINSNGVHAAAASLAGGRGGTDLSPADKKKAAKALVRLYGQMNQPAPPSIKNMAQ